MESYGTGCPRLRKILETVEFGSYSGSGLNYHCQNSKVLEVALTSVKSVFIWCYSVPKKLCLISWYIYRYSVKHCYALCYVMINPSIFYPVPLLRILFQLEQIKENTEISVKSKQKVSIIFCLKQLKIHIANLGERLVLGDKIGWIGERLHSICFLHNCNSNLTSNFVSRNICQ